MCHLKIIALPTGTKSIVLLVNLEPNYCGTLVEIIKSHKNSSFYAHFFISELVFNYKSVFRN